MKRIFAKLLMSAMVLGGGLAAGRAANPPQWFPFRSPTAKPAPKTVITDPAVELAAMQTRTVTIQAPASSGPGGPSLQMVNSRSLVVEFDLKDLGPSGLGEVELWYTRNGQIWAKSPGAPQKQSPFVLETSEDGVYGFTVVASNGMGVAKPAPHPGDAPQMWVDVDTTNPEVHLLGTQAGADRNGRTLTLRWTARDRNLVSRPITLCYAERAEGPWTPFAMNLENNGIYTWHMSPGLTGRILVRVQATDRVGNIGGDETIIPAAGDMTRPSATVRNVTRNGVIVPVNGRE